MTAIPVTWKRVTSCTIERSTDRSQIYRHPTRNDYQALRYIGQGRYESQGTFPTRDEAERALA